MDNQNNNQNQQQKVYYEKVSLLRRPKDAPLEDAVFAVSGTVDYAEVRSGQYGDFISIKMSAVLPDKSVERTFGADFVAPDHKVSFDFNLTNYDKERFEKYTPRWGQDIIFLLYDMETVDFTKRSGGVGHTVRAKCAGFAALGSLKKVDGTDRPPIRINGQSTANAPAAAPGNQGYQRTQQPAQYAPAAPANNVADDLGRLGVDTYSDDGELPF